MGNKNVENYLSVIIPAFNEESTILTVLKRVCNLKNIKEVIVVDDASVDKTVQKVEEANFPNVKLIKQEKNGGKTSAVRRGLEEVTGKITIIQDADLEYDPYEIEDVISPILEGKADVVYGSRFLVKRTSRVLYYYHYLANKFLTTLSNLLTNVNMTDIETCYKSFRTPLIKNLPLTSSGFGMEVEITAIITKTKARIYEVPISYYGRTYEEGKKIFFSDGITAILYILYYNLVAYFSPSIKKYIKESNEILEKVRKSEIRDENCI